MTPWHSAQPEQYVCLQAFTQSPFSSRSASHFFLQGPVGGAVGGAVGGVVGGAVGGEVGGASLGRGVGLGLGALVPFTHELHSAFEFSTNLPGDCMPGNVANQPALLVSLTPAHSLSASQNALASSGLKMQYPAPRVPLQLPQFDKILPTCKV